MAQKSLKNILVYISPASENIFFRWLHFPPGYISKPVKHFDHFFRHWLHFVVSKTNPKCNWLHFPPGYISRHNSSYIPTSPSLHPGATEHKPLWSLIPVKIDIDSMISVLFAFLAGWQKRTDMLPAP